ncbi:hypothetical protein C8T65DRAFT_251112 [Cerioporus squamosus]|nr:hypothetical protein C8T65DRAFT_251112 [Cerioporus squamosus]
MPTLVLCTLVLLSLFAFAWAAGSAYIDDSDSRILYSGSWTKNPISDPESFNYGGTLTYTNDATAKATLTFSGAIQVTVVGSFPVAGTFAMHSSYSIDGTGVTQFEPPSVISHPAYRQQFFVSNTLSTGTHELVIANLGRAFYLDYIVLTVPASSTPSLSSTPTHSSAPSVPSQSTTNPPTQLVALSTVVVITQVEAPTTQIIQASKGLRQSTPRIPAAVPSQHSPKQSIPQLLHRAFRLRLRPLRRMGRARSLPPDRPSEVELSFFHLESTHP